MAYITNRDLYHAVTDNPTLSKYLVNQDARIEPWFTDGGFIAGFTLTTEKGTATFSTPLVATKKFTVNIDNRDDVIPHKMDTVSSVTFTDSKNFENWLANELTTIIYRLEARSRR